MQQYDFSKNWSSKIEPLFYGGAPRRALSGLLTRFISDMTELRDSGGMTSQDYSRTIREALTKFRNLEWLRWQFEADDLSSVVFEIAKVLWPDGRWRIVENMQHSIAVSMRRKLVLDIKYFDKISATESLYYAGDSETLKRKPSVPRLTALLDQKVAGENEVLKKVQTPLSQTTKH